MKTPIAELYARDCEQLACRPEDIAYAAAVIEYALTADPRLAEFRGRWQEACDSDAVYDEAVAQLEQDIACAFSVAEMEAYCRALHIAIVQCDDGWKHTIRCVASMQTSRHFFGWTSHSVTFEHKENCVLDAFITYVIEDN